MPKYTDKELLRAVRDSKSLTETLRRLGYATGGSAHRTVRRRIEQLGYSTEHFSLTRRTKAWTLEEVYSTYGVSLSQPVKRKIRDDLGNVCECGQGPEWKGKPLTLQIDHINGDPSDHRRENLRLLCPNCHTQTGNYGKRNSIHPPNLCRGCNTMISRKAIRCRTCAGEARRSNRSEAGTSPTRTKIEWPDIESLRRMVWTFPCTQIGELLGVSDNAVRKRCRKLGIELPPRGYFLRKEVCPDGFEPPSPRPKRGAKPDSAKGSCESDQYDGMKGHH